MVSKMAQLLSKKKLAQIMLMFFTCILVSFFNVKNTYADVASRIINLINGNIENNK